MSAGYRASFEQFLGESPEEVIGTLASAAARSGHARQWHSQTTAWREELEILRRVIAAVVRSRPAASTWTVLLEYEIPRRERRIDAVLLPGGAIVVVEFKAGAATYDAASAWQVREYALDLRDFHKASRGRPIFPVLVATGTPEGEGDRPRADSEAAQIVMPVLRAAHASLPDIVLHAGDVSEHFGQSAIDAAEWDHSDYRPALNIIEAAAEIFAGHQVREIAHAAADNLTATTGAIVRVIRRAQAERKRVICFVTGVPGAGKTLTGLSAVHDPELRREDGPAAVFLSGNGPLVRVVRAALVRDVSKRGGMARESGRQVSTFIQNVHQFLGEYGIKYTGRVPPERVVVFDEAQRAWNAGQMKRKRGVLVSEPQMMLDVMERCADWSVVVALVGGGQEIHSGEAGLSEWGRALSMRAGVWEVVASSEALSGGASMAGQPLFDPVAPEGMRIRADGSLHLRTNIRSFRAQVVGEWVNAVLARDADRARNLFSPVDEFPVVMTRDLSVARAWLRAHAAGEKRPGVVGLVASSGAMRLRSYGLEVSSGFRRSYPFEEWFLADGGDVRSSHRLEVAATEFECQGLELDWVGMCWGDDVTFDGGSREWQLRRFIGTRWTSIGDAATRQYVLNKYRVLLTRARRGMIIWVPEGDVEDPTRDTRHLRDTADFLRACGVPEAHSLR